jgi:hypothetical protein
MVPYFIIEPLEALSLYTVMIEPIETPSTVPSINPLPIEAPSLSVIMMEQTEAHSALTIKVPEDSIIPVAASSPSPSKAPATSSASSLQCPSCSQQPADHGQSRSIHRPSRSGDSIIVETVAYCLQTGGDELPYPSFYPTIRILRWLGRGCRQVLWSLWRLASCHHGNPASGGAYYEPSWS